MLIAKQRAKITVEQEDKNKAMIKKNWDTERWVNIPSWKRGMIEASGVSIQRRWSIKDMLPETEPWQTTHFTEHKALINAKLFVSVYQFVHHTLMNKLWYMHLTIYISSMASTKHPVNNVTSGHYFWEALLRGKVWVLNIRGISCVREVKWK